MQERVEVVVVGGGPAGLAISHELTEGGIEHVVLERGRVGQSWRDRWDSFCLVTPNWSVKLPGGAYVGDDPDGFMPRDEIVAHLEAYASSFAAPVREGVEVSSLDGAEDGGFALRTADGVLHAERVVLASGAFQRPHRPPGAATLPGDIVHIDVEGYSNPGALPAGRVLVVGSGQTGCQLAEELHEAGREVFISCGRAPWSPRRIGNRDTMYWAAEIGAFDETLADLPSPLARMVGNPQATGHGGGHDLHYRVLQRIGVTLLGHFVGVEGGRAHFAPDLAASVAFGDARYKRMREKIAKLCAARGIAAPDMGEPAPFDPRAPESLDLEGFGAVIFASGFAPDYTSWVHLDAFDERGFPIQQDGASTVVPGLHFCGVPFLRKRKSSLLIGIGEDAEILTRELAAERHPARTI
ncbi:MAG: NAD(P)-binding domain-containing protein [Solirubrobacterales bacterium]|nr:NAD(P)-binding domain-containing protein [Solirubrobacterales bacterium]